MRTRAQESTLQLKSGRVLRCLKVVKLVVRKSGARPGEERHLVHAGQTSADGVVHADSKLLQGKQLDGEVRRPSDIRACA